ncbi:uncharacterized protein ISCGN_005524 [Ixodes scapularis]
MKLRAVEGRLAPHQILLDAASSVTDDTASQIPAASTLRRTIRKQRQRANFVYSVPSCRADIRMPAEFKVTAKGDSFFLHDSGDGDSERLLIFATERNLSYLARATTWFADGTFKVTPEQFYQLYTAHAVVNGVVVPMVYGLLPNKSETTYRRFVDVLLSHVGTHCVEVVYTDFEIAAINAIKAMAPSARIQGCFFHLSQSVYRKVCSSGLQSRYNADEEFAVKMRMLPALAFLPISDIPEAFQDLVEVFPSEAAHVADYFEDVYIGRPRRNGMSTAIFLPTVWSVGESTLAEMPRTNNSIETWHRGLQSNVGCSSPNIWAFLGCVKREQSLTEMKLAQAEGGTTSSRVSKKHADCNERLHIVVSRYDSRNRLETLRAAARNIAF